jgi:thioredoxin 1
MTLISSILIGAGLGLVMGYYGRCAPGTCPLTATPGRGAIYGMVLGFLFYVALGRNGAGSVSESTANVKLVNGAEFESAIAQTTNPVVVDFFAPWCGECRRLGPVLDEVAGSLTNQIRFLKVNVEKSAPIAEKYNVEGIPTLMFFQNGKASVLQVGLVSKADLEARLRSLISSPERSVARE